MTNGPLPPHERNWRHPSELAAPEPEPPTRAGRILIVATATVSLLLVGALAVTLAPRHATQSQDALVASTLLVLGGPLAAGSASTAPTTIRARAIEPAGAVGFSSEAGAAGENNTAGAAGENNTAGAAGENNTAGAAGENNTAGAGPATTEFGAPEAATPPGEVVVTPLGGALAVTTESALIGVGARIAAVVPSGDDVIADVIYVAADIAFVLIVGSFPDDTMAVAPRDAPAGDLYLALGDSLVLVDSSTLTRASVPEGAPLVNADGALVGLCTYGPDGIEMVPVGALPDVPVAGSSAAGSSAPSPAGSPDSSRPAPASSPAPSHASPEPSSHPSSGPPSVSTAPAGLTLPGTSPATSGGAVASSEATGSSTPAVSLDSSPASSVDPTGSTS